MFFTDCHCDKQLVDFTFIKIPVVVLVGSRKIKMSCSFKVYGGECGLDFRSRKAENVIPLLSCCKDIANHKKSLNFSGVETEVDLILSRCGIFQSTSAKHEMTICPSHRSRLGIGWRRARKSCCMPPSISKHAKDSRYGPLAKRGISLLQSRKIFEMTNHLVPVGSGKK